MQKIENFQAWNEDMVAKHDPEAYHLQSNPAIRFVEGMRVRAILKAIRCKPADTVLEVGCGAGNVLERIAAAKLVGIDLSSRMVKRTRERLSHRNVSVLQANAESLPFSVNSMDGVFCTEVMEHVENPDRIIEEIWRVAKPGASVAISVPNEIMIDKVKDFIRACGLGRFFFGGGYKVPERMADEWHLHVFDVRDLLKRLAVRFKVEKVTAIPSRFLPLRYVFACKPLKFV